MFLLNKVSVKRNFLFFKVHGYFFSDIFFRDIFFLFILFRPIKIASPRIWDDFQRSPINEFVPSFFVTFTFESCSETLFHYFMVHFCFNCHERDETIIFNRRCRFLADMAILNSTSRPLCLQGSMPSNKQYNHRRKL